VQYWERDKLKKDCTKTHARSKLELKILNALDLIQNMEYVNGR